MKDKNGIEMRTGDVVKISGAYFKNDNGTYVILGEPDGINSNHYHLRKITGKGKISRQKGVVNFWPLIITTTSPERTQAAEAWNKEHATIEIIEPPTYEYIIEWFEYQASVTELQADYMETLSRDAEDIEIERNKQALFESVVKYLKSKSK